MTANAHSLSRPYMGRVPHTAHVPHTGPVPRSGMPGSSSRPVNVGHLALSPLASAPFWARQYTRLFLAGCSGITEDTSQTAELIVSELVTNAARALAGDLAERESSYSQRAGLGVIRLSLRAFDDGLLIEVRDSSPEAPVLVQADRDAECQRGLMIVDALCEEWGYVPAPGGGKVVYSYLRLALANRPRRPRRKTLGPKTGPDASGPRAPAASRRA